MPKRRGKIQDPSMRQRTITVVESNGACEVQFVSKQIHVAWSTARAILLDLVREGKLRVMRTTGGFVFLPSQEPSSASNLVEVSPRRQEVVAEVR